MYHLKWDMVDEKYRGLTRLLDDHLAQGVWQCCRYPGWTNDDHQHLTPLNPVSEDVEGSSEYDEPQEEEPVHTAGSLAAKLQCLDLSSGGGLDRVTE